MRDLPATVRHLAHTKITPRARGIDSTSAYAQDIFEELQRADLLGLRFPDGHGGSGAGVMGPTLAVEEVTKYSNVLGHGLWWD